jgi:RHH-type proline utilization regulon transcriptional repressor/proline dehydrogenase/delta 1-pyrroline-5-carboxylate dehydrogenase
MWNTINRHYLADEAQCVAACLARLDGYDGRAVEARAAALIERLRAEADTTLVQSFMGEYDLSSREGLVLMCLAEALLRIPDEATADRLVRDKLVLGDWAKHAWHSHSWLVNVATLGLAAAETIEQGFASRADFDGEAQRLFARLGQPTIRKAMALAMQAVADLFVMDENMDSALAKIRRPPHDIWLYSFDRLGEAAVTAADGERYFQAYRDTIASISSSLPGPVDPLRTPGISVKLSALFPRYEYGQRRRVLETLAPRLLLLAQDAARSGIPLTVDAEEAERLTLSLEIFAAVYHDPSLAGRDGLGLAVQAYQKRAPAVIEWLAELAQSHGRRIPVRLVKGAYWDTEIKRAQVAGLADYPVYTRKAHTDVAYLACARLLLGRRDLFYPQFASHNAHTACAVLQLAGDSAGFEFQRLHGMGEALHARLLDKTGVPCRVYAPIGRYRELLPYLVRRLLENGANNSFVNQLGKDSMPVAQLAADPVLELRSRAATPGLALPPDLYGPARRNSQGKNLADEAVLQALLHGLQKQRLRRWQAAPLIGGESWACASHPLASPFDGASVGSLAVADPSAIARALDTAHAAFPAWQQTPVEQRAACLLRAADLLEEQREELLALLILEGGKTIPDALAELREAVDYCRYYAAEALRLFRKQPLPGPTGEDNGLYLEGRGVFVCISPWNFPLAIFLGQAAAALAAGNCVVAKPSLKTPLLAMRAVELLRQAGVPSEVLAFLPASGSDTERCLLADSRVAGVAFTGSTETAQRINRCLATRDSALAVLIAETGGQNALIADSSALPEQLVLDVLRSAFNSAGQRCSALRVLFLPEPLAERVLEMLQGAMAELRLGDPMDIATDVGPVIDREAASSLRDHLTRRRAEGCNIYQMPLPAGVDAERFFAPCLVELDSMTRLTCEVFGPVLHVVRYATGQLAEPLRQIEAAGFGLTLGIHSRIQANIDYIRRHARVGNLYVNRDMIGAVVGVQPFGGQGLSGTGPKAGGPHYLARFATEKTVSINTAAIGGNIELLSGVGTTQSQG